MIKADIQIRAIGYLSSCFQHKFGTPRQGSLTPSSRGRIELDKSWIGSGSFDGLSGFSHVWLITWLHRFNHDRNQVKSKVHPPRLEGASLGVFATRSPHLVMLMTECSMSDNVAVNFPDTEFIRPCNLCPHMKRITLSNIRQALLENQHVVTIDPAIASRARMAVERMLSI